MAFPLSPSNKDLHIENGITFRYISAKNRWELWDDSDATETNLDSEYRARKSADSDLQIQIFDNDSDILSLQSIDSDQWVAIFNNDSDILYLQDNAVKYRGRIDVTQNGPLHEKIGNGDLYLATTSGTVDSEWGGLNGQSVAVNQAIIYADSDWRFLGGVGGGGADSDHIANVESLYEYLQFLPYENNRRLHRLHYANETDTLFFEKDSDVFYVFEGEALYPQTPVLLEGQPHIIGSNPPRSVDCVLNGAGPNTAGNVKVTDKNGRIKQLLNLSTVSGMVTEPDGSRSFTGIGSDSEAVTINVYYANGENIEFGDEIIFTPVSGNKSIVKCFDPKLRGFKRVSKIRMDLDSDVDRLMSADSDIQVRLTDHDSDILWLYGRDSDFTSSIDSDILALQSKDSDLQLQITDNDSDIHDLFAFDSDLSANIDSDLLVLRSADSDLSDRLSVAENLVLFYNTTDEPAWQGDSDAVRAREGSIATLAGVEYARADIPPIPMDVNNFASGWVSSGESGGASNNDITWRAFDDSTAGLFQSFDPANPEDTWLQLSRQLPSDPDWVATQIRLTHPGTNGNAGLLDRSWTSFDLYGLQSDLTTLEFMQSFTVPPTTEQGQTDTFVITDNLAGAAGTGYRGFRLVCTGNNGHPSTATIQDLSLNGYRLSSAFTSPYATFMRKNDVGSWDKLLINAANISADSDWILRAINEGDSDVRLELDSDVHGLKAADSDLLVRIIDNDSDILALQSMDSDQWVVILDNDSDILALQSKDSDLQVQITDNDSDILRLYSDDSDIRVRITDNDSDILRLYSDDSDIRVRITDNDSDIAYLFTHTVKYRGQVDMTNEGPDSDYKVGDVYFSIKAGFIADSGWGPLVGQPIAKHQAVIFSDSDWIYFGGSGGGGGLDDSDFHALKAKDSDARTDIDYIFNSGTFVQYDNDSEITVNGIKFSGDSEYAALRWNDDDKTLDLFLSGEPILQVGQEIVFFAKANEAISNGDLVMFAGAQGDHLLMRKADRTVTGFIPEWIMGVATSDIANNQFGYVTQIGKVRGLNTSAFTEGQLLYMDSDNPGALTGTQPEWPIKSVLVAAVTRSHATEGSIYVRVSSKPDLTDIHDVNITEPAEGTKHNQLLMWDSDTEFWVNRTIDTDFGTF